MVNGDGLRITVLMQNSGLPEAGDAVLTFPPRRAGRPRARTRPPPRSRPEGPETERAARGRRDLAVEGYLPLRAALEDGDTGPLRAFHRVAARIVARQGGRLAGALAGRARWPPRSAPAQQLDALDAGDPSHLADAGAVRRGPTRRGGYGMCGRRDEYELPGTTLPYHGE